jgi:hypothetical protein
VSRLDVLGTPSGGAVYEERDLESVVPVTFAAAPSGSTAGEAHAAGEKQEAKQTPEHDSAQDDSRASQSGACKARVAAR